MTRTGTHHRLGAVSAGRMPQVTALSPLRLCQTKRWRAATLLPHSNPPDQVFDRIKTV
jgi:hypothetical protein